jgi:hypothetical protein
MAFGSQNQVAAASITATCKNRRFVLRDIARPQFPQPQQILPGQRHLVARAMPGADFSSNLGLLAQAHLHVPVVLLVEREEGPTQDLSTLAQIGGSALQQRGQKSQGSVNRTGNAKLNRIFMSKMRIPTTNPLMGCCKQVEFRTWSTPT